jgi:aspartate carbamoyltransferase catalytic subunit
MSFAAYKQADLEKFSGDGAEIENYLRQVRASRNLSFTSLISVDDLNMEDVKLLFDLTVAFKKLAVSDRKKLSLLRGKSIINLFFENSTRTKTSFELGGKHLGADTINFSEKGSSAEKGETVGDTAKTLDDMAADLIICRNSQAGMPYLIAREIDAPVINAGDGRHEHPTQALFDAFTICENLGDFSGLKVCIVGDILHSRVAGSLMRLLPRLGIELHLCGPATLLPEGVDQFTKNIHYDLDKIIGEMDVIYSLRVQSERDAMRYIPSKREYSKNYGIGVRRLGLVKQNAIFMHPGPVIREVDLSSEALGSSHCKIDDQVTNGFCLRMALMWLLIDRI